MCQTILERKILPIRHSSCQPSIKNKKRLPGSDPLGIRFIRGHGNKTNPNNPLLAILLVTFLGWWKPDPFRGSWWPPIKGIKKVTAEESPGVRENSSKFHLHGLIPFPKKWDNDPWPLFPSFSNPVSAGVWEGQGPPVGRFYQTCIWVKRKKKTGRRLMIFLVGGFNPIWKILLKMGNLPQSSGWK